MDVIDRLLDDQNAAEQGVALKDAPTIPPEFLAGNKLTDALDACERYLGPDATATLLMLAMTNRPIAEKHPLILDLIAAVNCFRANVTPALFEQRLKARIARLRS